MKTKYFFKKARYEESNIYNRLWKKKLQLHLWLWCLCVWRNCFTGLDLTFPNYHMGRLIVAKYYENFKWKITIEVQRTTRNFTTFMFICFRHVCSSSSLIEVPFAYFILLWWIIRRDVEASSEFPFLLVCVNQSLMLFPCCFCGFLSSTSAVFVWRAFSKIKHLPHWQHFWTLSAKFLAYRRHKASFYLFFSTVNLMMSWCLITIRTLTEKSGNCCNAVISMEKKLWCREGDERVLKGEVLSVSIKEKSFLSKSLIQ